jgi:hypothetical protein
MRVDGALAVGFENFKIAFDRRSHRQRASGAIGRLRATHHPRASLVLRLRKTQNDCPVSIAEVVGGADFLEHVALASDVVARNPCPCHSRSSLAAFQPAVADVQARLEQPVVWLATAGETTAALSALKPCIRSSARHRSCPTNVQYADGNAQKTGIHKYDRFLAAFKHLRDVYGNLWPLLRLSQGENRGSSPIGSANTLNSLAFANLCSGVPYGNCTE